MTVFPSATLQLAFKRSRINGHHMFKRTLEVLNIVRQVFGECTVNFDAETLRERLVPSDLAKLCDMGFEIHETYQCGRAGDHGYFEQLVLLWATYPKFGLNLVLGNPRYGCTPHPKSFLEKTQVLINQSKNRMIKVGVEGPRYAETILHECKRLGAYAYILNTPATINLVSASKELGLKVALYTPIRLSETGGDAFIDAIRLMGDYLVRRGVDASNFKCDAHRYMVYGSPTDAAHRLSELFGLGVDVAVLSPVFDSETDLRRQLSLILKCL